MITHLNGVLAYKEATKIVVECGGVGYKMSISTITYEQLPVKDSKVFVYTVLVPREDSWNLYGFVNKEEREFFLLLTSVSGIGPRIALGILSACTISELHQIISVGDLVSLVKLPGIGKKTAERLTLELKDKVLKIANVSDSGLHSTSTNMMEQEAISALMTLGYNKKSAEVNVKKASKALGYDVGSEELIKRALKFAMS